MHSGLFPEQVPGRRIWSLIGQLDPLPRQIGWRGQLQIVAGATQAGSGCSHLGVIAEGRAGASGQSRQDQAMQPHGDHQRR